MSKNLLRLLLPTVGLLGAIAWAGAAPNAPHVHAQSAATPAITSTVTSTVTGTATSTATPQVAGTKATTATATAKATPAPAASAAVTATGATTATVPAGPSNAVVRSGAANKRLNVRSGPDTTFPIIARLNDATPIMVQGRNQGGTWLQILLPGQANATGWVSANYVTLKTAADQLPVVAAPSAPATSAASATAAATAAANAPAAAAATAAPTAVAPNPVPTPAVTARTAPAPVSGKFVIPIFDETAGEYDLWAANADGSNLRQVVTQASAPALSSDGALLAYRHWQRDDRGLVVANGNGSNALRVTDHLEDALSSFSPDNKKLVFSSYREMDRRSRLYYVWTDEQNRRAWEWGPGGLYGENPVWMADGQIVYRTAWPTSQLWLMSSDATNQRPFYTSEASMADLAASPDSKTVAYMGLYDNNWDIYTVDIATGKALRLTTDAARDGVPAFSPDGQSIAFLSDRDGQWGLWVMNRDGSNQRRLFVLPGSPDGQVRNEPDYLNRGWVEQQLAWSK